MGIARIVEARGVEDAASRMLLLPPDLAAQLLVVLLVDPSSGEDRKNWHVDSLPCALRVRGRWGFG